MARKLLCIFVLVFLFYGNAFSQAKVGTTLEDCLSFFWDFYSENNIGTRVWGMGGAGVANVNDLTATVINPAALEFKDRFSFYFEGLNKTKTRWLKQYDPEMFLKSPSILPTFAGVSYKITDDVYAGLVYSYPRYYKLDLGTVYVTTTEDPLPVGTTNPRMVLHHKQLIWQINAHLGKGLCVGSNVNYNWISADVIDFYINDPFEPSKIWYLTKESDVDFVNFKFGALVKIHQIVSFKGSGKMNLGIVYTPQKSFEPMYKWKSAPYPEEFSLGKKTLPMKLEMGFKIYDLSFPVCIAGDVKFYDNSEVEKLVDRWDIHLGFEWEANENLALQAGYFSKFDYRDPDGSWVDEVGEYDQHFLTAGVSISLYDYLLQFSIRDSHLLSSGFIETTQISVGGGVRF